jgi:hypothetical protein
MGISGIAADYYPAGYVNSKAAKVEERVLRRSLNRNQWRQINNIVWTGHPKHSIR